MTAINRGNRVWVIRGNDVEKGTVTSSYGDSCGIMYRVRWGKKDAAWSGIATVSQRDIFRDEATACGELADRLTSLANELRNRACGDCLKPWLDQHLCRHGIERLTDTTTKGRRAMNKAKKVSRGTYQYRGFIIDSAYRSGWQIMCRDTHGWLAFSDTLRQAKARIDDWYDARLTGRRVEAQFAQAVERILSDACERGETDDCPDQHLCRHGIDQ